MILVLDNYDSFTYNLVQYLGELGETVEVYRNDAITVDEVAGLQPEAIVVSPGPCTPHEAGISTPLVRELGPRIPLLGVCLGHQAIGAAFGGRIVRAGELMHGKSSDIHHDGHGVFLDLPNPFEAIRYHSLVIERDTVPASLDHHSRDQERADYGCSPPRASHRGGAVPSRIDHDGRRQRLAPQLPGASAGLAGVRWTERKEADRDDSRCHRPLGDG